MIEATVCKLRKDELSRRYRHNGYMTEALRAMVQNAFEVMNVEVVAISPFVGTEPSRKVIERVAKPQTFGKMKAKKAGDAK